MFAEGCDDQPVDGRSALLLRVPSVCLGFEYSTEVNGWVRQVIFSGYTGLKPKFLISVQKRIKSSTGGVQGEAVFEMREGLSQPKCRLWLQTGSSCDD
jgi:hypothetical protein